MKTTDNVLFYMRIEDVFFIKCRGLVATGKIEHGSVIVGDALNVKTENGNQVKENIRLDGLEIFGHITVATEGMNIGLFFKIPHVQTIDEALEILPIRQGHIFWK